MKKPPEKQPHPGCRWLRCDRCESKLGQVGEGIDAGVALGRPTLVLWCRKCSADVGFLLVLASQGMAADCSLAQVSDISKDSVQGLLEIQAARAIPGQGMF